MTTALLAIPEIFVGRLRDAQPGGIPTKNIRRSRRTPVTREQLGASRGAIQVQVVDVRTLGDGGNCLKREMRVRVSIIVRDDDTLDKADPIVSEATDALAQDTPAGTGLDYPRNVTLSLTSATVDEETADEDAIRIELEYDVQFRTNEFRLSIL